MQIAVFLILGILSGILSGLIGIGGGVFIIPALIYLFGFSQHQAQGTTLAVLLPPISLLSVIVYYKHGNVNLLAAAFICIGFFLGGYYGANFANALHPYVLKKIFGAILLALSLQMILTK